VKSPQYDRFLQLPPYRLGKGPPPYGADLLRLGLLKKKTG
jgi:hypothetical protein